MKTVKMIFPGDMFYNLELIYKGGEVVEVPEDKVVRWLKRGGQIVAEIPPEALAEKHEDLEEKLEEEQDDSEAPRKHKGRQRRRS